MQNLKMFLTVIFAMSLSMIYGVNQLDEALVAKLKNSQLRLIVVRHAEATHNVANYISSSLTPGIYLTDLGEQQAKQMAIDLRDENINRIYVSPVYRSLQTAQIIAKNLPFSFEKITTDDRLKEQNFGIFEGNPYQNFFAYFSTKVDLYTLAAPEGESGEQVFDRTRDLLWEIALNHSQETILLVTHAINACHINKCLNNIYGEFPAFAVLRIYDYTAP